jgi:ketosteroid isomerase-like protein
MAKDTAAIERFYADGGHYLPQWSDGYVGPDAIRERWAGEISGGDFTLEREPMTIEVAQAGDMAYEVGTYKVAWTKPTQGQSGGGTGNYVAVWKKVGSEWKTAAYIWLTALRALRSSGSRGKCSGPYACQALGAHRRGMSHLSWDIDAEKRRSRAGAWQLVATGCGGPQLDDLSSAKITHPIRSMIHGERCKGYPTPLHAPCTGGSSLEGGHNDTPTPADRQLRCRPGCLSTGSANGTCRVGHSNRRSKVPSPRRWGTGVQRKCTRCHADA